MQKMLPCRLIETHLATAVGAGWAATTMHSGGSISQCFLLLAAADGRDASSPPQSAPTVARSQHWTAAAARPHHPRRAALGPLDRSTLRAAAVLPVALYVWNR